MSVECFAGLIAYLHASMQETRIVAATSASPMLFRPADGVDAYDFVGKYVLINDLAELTWQQ